ncbi:MAG: NTPase [Candidatus Thorarchaeota archaeon]
MNILITGNPGIGKTTAIKKMVQYLGKEKACGFWSEEIRESDRRVGFAIYTLDGKTAQLAHVNLKSGPRVGKYLVNIEGIQQYIIPALVDAREKRSWIIIDEIASMELKCDQFASEVRRCLDTGRVIGTLQLRSGSFQDEVRRRPDVLLLHMTHENREEIPDKVLRILESATSSFSPEV